MPKIKMTIVITEILPIIYKDHIGNFTFAESYNRRFVCGSAFNAIP